jgi:putative YhdH/YhfP family quinone oxidoreductase
MENIKFRAYRVFEKEDGTYERKIVERSTNELPENDVLVRVKYSALNYKDALSATGNKGVTRKFPHTPGIDAAGIVVEDKTGNHAKGTQVIVSGNDLGMNTDGGFGEYIRVPGLWLFPLPEALTLKESMMIGGTGFTAGLSVFRLLQAGQIPELGPVLVTGAAGGVGSMAVLILKKLGFEVIAATSNKEDSSEFIEKLGADKHVDKSVTDDQSGKALRKPQWAGAIDVVGGNVLATALKSCEYGGNVTSCGNIFSPKLEMTVYPFILNAVSLLGVDAARCPYKIKKEVWERLTTAWKVDTSFMTNEIKLDELDDALQKLINKKNRGQTLLKHDHQE